MHILFTGGGSAGHVTPNIALIKEAKSRGWQTSYVGSYQGMEQDLIAPLNIPYYAISTGKLRRNFSWRNFLSPFQVIHGLWQSYWLCNDLKPDVVFSKGGFVAVPVVIGAWLNKIPVISHESDLSPGLANRISYPFIKKIGLSMPHSQKYFKDQSKVVFTGTPIRKEILQGDALRGKKWLGFEDAKPILMIYGGGLGSVTINQAVRECLPQLLERFNIVHGCGKGKTDSKFDGMTGYRQFEYISNELPDVLAAADLVISRAGANSIYELLTLQKPHLLIPLSAKASRGDQIENAAYFSSLGVSDVLSEDDLNTKNLMQHIEMLWQHRDNYQAKMSQLALPNAIDCLLEIIEREKK